MNPDMKNLLSGIKASRDKKAQELFDHLEADIRSVCKKFYEETGCTISEIKFPVRAIYTVCQKGPATHAIMLPQIQISELNMD